MASLVGDNDAHSTSNGVDSTSFTSDFDLQSIFEVNLMHATDAIRNSTFQSRFYINVKTQNRISNTLFIQVLRNASIPNVCKGQPIFLLKGRTKAKKTDRFIHNKFNKSRLQN